MTSPAYFCPRGPGCHAVHLDKTRIIRDFFGSPFGVPPVHRALYSPIPIHSCRCCQVAAPTRYASERFRRHYHHGLVSWGRSFTEAESGRRTSHDLSFRGATRSHEQRPSAALERGGAIVLYREKRRKARVVTLQSRCHLMVLRELKEIEKERQT